MLCGDEAEPVDSFGRVICREINKDLQKDGVFLQIEERQA